MSDDSLHRFEGFPAGKSGLIRIPDLFFSQLLPLIDDLAELKLTVYCFWAVQQREGKYRYVRLRDLLADRLFMVGLDSDPAGAEQKLRAALETAIARGTLLHIVLPAGITGTNSDEDLYFINTDKGRKAIAALQKGDWSPGTFDHPVGLIHERPNIYALYEENIGPLTPLLADTLRDAETTYPADWIQEGIQIAVENNKRNWKYVEAILKRWMVEGKTSLKKENQENGVNKYLRDSYFQDQIERE